MGLGGSEKTRTQRLGFMQERRVSEMPTQSGSDRPAGGRENEGRKGLKWWLGSRESPEFTFRHADFEGVLSYPRENSRRQRKV